METIPYSRQWIDEEDLQAVCQVLRSDWLTQGPTVESFENGLSEAAGVARAVAVSNGTAALHLCYAGMGVKNGSTGITSPITFAATANALLHCGAEVRFCDVDPATGLMEPDSLEQTIKEQKPAGEEVHLVIPVSFAGRLAPLEEIAQISEAHGFSVVEDAAHSMGAFAKRNEHTLRSASCEHEKASILSFHPVKHICSGEGGAVLTNDEKLADKIVSLRSHGVKRPISNDERAGWYYEQTDLGWNYRMTDLQAALGLRQLKKLDSFLERRRSLADRYHKALKEEPFNEFLEVPAAEEGHAYHLFVILFRNPAHRDQAYEFLQEQGIRSQVHYIPVYRHPYYASLMGNMRLPGAESYFSRCLSIPLFPKLTDAEQEKVLEQLAAFLRAL
ncbi:MAG: UDP-4-amino-4,6-dideoxy-N-acetyl-beta-L-altrosamine transaminase [Opitutae bacterium]|nr:UDP-4-amino-4,6-dideoxy-N-acetyl-beta-L-altrosamine transaminase [Opitutae bacterium]|tara:strand:+ start:265 stop:1431 length:1167 start_codon:yes stop_codon:yes gene_type:complete